MKWKVHPPAKAVLDENEVQHLLYNIASECLCCYPQNKPESESNVPWVTEEVPREVLDGQDNPTLCTMRWKASAAEHEKRSLNIYKTTGIFICACHHGFIQRACEMVQSGKLYVLYLPDMLVSLS